MDEKPSIENWDDFAGDWLKADFIKTFPAQVVVIGVETAFDDNKARLMAIVEYNGREFKFDLNKTNQAEVRKVCNSPKALVGKKLILEKVKQRNPSTNSLVDSLLISKIE